MAKLCCRKRTVSEFDAMPTHPGALLSGKGSAISVWTTGSANGSPGSACIYHLYLPGHVTRDAVRRWRGARRQGSGAADAAAAVGVSRATLYRWAAGAEPRSRRPHTLRWPAWSAALATAVQETRAADTMWGKAKIAVLLRRHGHTVSESTTGRILEMPVDRGAVTPVPAPRRVLPAEASPPARG